MLRKAGHRGSAALTLVACLALAAPRPGRWGGGDPPRAPAPRLDSLRRTLRLPPPPVRQISASAYIGAPGSSFGSPTPFGMASSDYFVGVGYQSRTRYTHMQDG